MHYTEFDLAALQSHIDRHGTPEGFVPAPRRKRRNEESRIQKSVIAWWDMAASGYGLDQRLLAAVPNGALYGSGIDRVIRAKILLDEGLRPGYPDLLLDVARGNYHGLRIEMKKPKENPKLHQLSYHAILRAQGYAVHVARSFDEAVKIITEYLK